MNRLSGNFALLRIKQGLTIFLLLILILSTSGCSGFGKMLAQPYLKLANWIDEITSGYGKGDKVYQEKEKKEREELGLVIPTDVAGFEWKCRDVSGEISTLESISETNENLEIIVTKLDLEIKGADPENVLVDFDLYVERDEAYVDSETGVIEGWNHAQWTKEGDGFASISENGVFADVMDVSLAQKWTYPEGGSYETLESHAYFGLIPPGDFSLAYLCDRRANPVPEGLIDLTPENFRNYCTPGYYYECDLK